jgi:hypothetical protein
MLSQRGMNLTNVESGLIKTSNTSKQIPQNNLRENRILLLQHFSSLVDDLKNKRKKSFACVLFKERNRA